MIDPEYERYWKTVVETMQDGLMVVDDQRPKQKRPQREQVACQVIARVERVRDRFEMDRLFLGDPAGLKESGILMDTKDFSTLAYRFLCKTMLASTKKPNIKCNYNIDLIVIFISLTIEYLKSNISTWL